MNLTLSNRVGTTAHTPLWTLVVHNSNYLYKYSSVQHCPLLFHQTVKTLILLTTYISKSLIPGKCPTVQRTPTPLFRANVCEKPNQNPREKDDEPMPELTPQPGAYQHALLSNLTPSKTNYRKTFDKAGLEELAESIRAHGVLQPLVVRAANGKDDGDGRFEIVAGERRFRAAKLAKLDTVPVIVRELTDAAAREIRQRSLRHWPRSSSGQKKKLRRRPRSRRKRRRRYAARSRPRPRGNERRRRNNADPKTAALRSPTADCSGQRQ